MAIKTKYLIEKRNVLNELRANNMKLQELRFFSIYLAKINTRDISTRVVRFAMADFQKIMEIEFIKIDYLMSITNSLLSKVINIPDMDGYKAFQLFKQCRVNKDEKGEWFVEIDAHDEALPLMFDFKDKYFTYELWNALRLKSSNQLRMYEVLKQYEKIGERTISLDNLKELLGITRTDYPRYDSFRSDVIEVCKEALETYTDIKFVYMPIRKKGKGGKITSLKFIISRNENYIDPLSLSDFINIQNTNTNGDEMIESEIKFENESLEFLAESCNNEFNEAEMQILYNLITKIFPDKVGESLHDFQLRAYHHLKHRYDELNWQAGRKEIKSRFGYFKKILESDNIGELKFSK